MSNNQYIMKLVVDDTAVKQLEKRLQNIMGIKTGGTGTATSSGSSNNLFGNLGKLGLIAAGVALLVKSVQKILDLVVNSSPILQSTLKIFETSITLIFRPIGDFFGFFLRPIMLVFLTKVALPFYRLTAPLSKFLGSASGNVVGGNFQSNIEGWQLIVQGKFGDLWDKARVKMEQDWGNITTGFSDFAKDLKVPKELVDGWKTIRNFFLKLNLPEELIKGWASIRNFFLTLKLPKELEDGWRSIRNFFLKLKVPEALSGIWSSFTTFFSQLKIPDVVKSAVDTFFGFLKKLADWINGLPQMFKDWLGLGGNGNKSNSSAQIGANASTPFTFNYYGNTSPTSNRSDAQVMIEWVWKEIENRIKGK